MRSGSAEDTAMNQFAVLLPMREIVQGPKHPSTLAARQNLAHETGWAGDPAA